MRPSLCRITRLVLCGIGVALSLFAPGRELRTQEPTSARRQGVSLAMGLAWSELVGPASAGGVFGGGRLDLGYEHPFGRRLGLRVEGSLHDLRTDLGETGEIFLLPTTLSVMRIGLGVHARRYAREHAFVGAGVSMSMDAGCYVDVEGGPGFGGGETTGCEAFTESSFRPRAAVMGTVLTAGLQRGNWELELRYDQAITPTVDTDAGPLRGRSLAGVVHYRLGARSGSGSRPAPNDMRHAPRAPDFAHQAGRSSAGFLLGVAAGAGLGAIAANSSGEWDNTDQVATGAIVGAVLGPVVALHWDGARHGRRANVMATFAGSVLGTLLGSVAAYGAGDAAIPILLVAGPVGATAGYRLTDRPR